MNQELIKGKTASSSQRTRIVASTPVMLKESNTAATYRSNKQLEPLNYKPEDYFTPSKPNESLYNNNNKEN